MAHINKLLAVFLAVLVAGGVLTGCSGDMGPEDARELALQALANYDQLSYLKFDSTMPVSMTVIGGPQKAPVSITMEENGVVDNKRRALHIYSRMSLAGSSADDYQVPSDIYVMGDWLYMSLTYSDGGQQWMKSQITSDMWSLQNSLNNPVDLMRSSSSFTPVGEEQVNGAAQAVIAVEPGRDALGQWLNAQTVLNISSTTWAETDLPTVVKQAEYKFWIDRETQQITKIAIALTLEVTPGDVGAQATDFTQMTLEVGTTIQVYGHNTPFSLALPEGAGTAVDIGAMAGR
jgi:hypothetical protein